MSNERIVVAGAGGFIGGHLIAGLLAEGTNDVVAADLKPLDEWHQVFPDAENRVLDLRLRDACDEVVGGADAIYNLAADMGGMGFIESNKAPCVLARGTAAARRRRLRSAASPPRPSSSDVTRSTSGSTASRCAASRT